jgi:cytochrome c556
LKIRIKEQSRPQAVLASLLLLSLLTACDSKNERTHGPSPYIAQATLQELMLHVIDPNVDAIWNSVTTIADENGVIDIRPETDQDWTKLRGHAITLQEAANLLVIPGRKVAEAGAATSIHPVELSPEAISKKIESERQQFERSAKVLHQAAAEVIAAIDARDVDALEKAGGHVEHACEQCHSQFWYPNDSVPNAENTLGLRHSASSTYVLLRKNS